MIIDDTVELMKKIKQWHESNLWLLEQCSLNASSMAEQQAYHKAYEIFSELPTALVVVDYEEEYECTCD